MTAKPPIADVCGDVVKVGKHVIWACVEPPGHFPASDHRADSYVGGATWNAAGLTGRDAVGEVCQGCGCRADTAPCGACGNATCWTCLCECGLYQSQRPEEKPHV